MERCREQPGLGVVLMPYYFRRTDGSQVYATFTELGEVLSYRVDAQLMRGPDTATWVAVGDGLPMPVEANITRVYTASAAPEILSALSSLRAELGANSEGVVGVGYESPTDSGVEWERPLWGVPSVFVSQGSSRHVIVRMRLLLGPTVYRLTRAVTSAGDTLVDHEGSAILYGEEV